MKSAVAQLSNKNSKFLELMSILLGTVSVGLTLIFIVLKQDGQTAVRNWPWSLVVIPSSISAFAFLCLWTFLHYQQLSNEVDRRWNMDLARQALNSADVDNIDKYHERYLFRDLMMVFVHIITISYAVIINASPCSSACTTPFGMFATVITVLNFFRLLFLFIRGYFDFYRIRELCQEVRYFKTWRNETRLRDMSFHPLLHVITSIFTH